MFFTSQAFSQSQIKLLEQAYNEDSDSLMKMFFENWEKMTPYDYSNYSNVNDTIKVIKEIYKSFYDSLDFFKADKINLLPNDIEYSIVERVLYFQWYDDPRFFEIHEDNERRDTMPCPRILYNSHVEETIYSKRIVNFRPIITKEQVLFLDSLYSGRINIFLLGKLRKENFTNIFKNLNHNFDKYIARLKFLQSYFPFKTFGERIYDKNNISFYNKFLSLFAEDTILKIEIDKNLKFAIVTTVGSLSSIDHYFIYRNNDSWEIKGSTTMWID